MRKLIASPANVIEPWKKRLSENHKEQGQLGQKIRSLEPNSSDRKRLQRRKSRLIKEAREINQKISQLYEEQKTLGKHINISIRSVGKTPQELVFVKELEYVLCRRLNKCEEQRWRKSYSLYLCGDDAISKATITTIFGAFRKNYHNIYPIVLNNLHYDILGKPDYSDATSSLEKELKNSFGDNARLAAKIYLDIIKNSVDLTVIKQAGQAKTSVKGRKLEDDCAKVLRDAGYAVRATKGSGDYGIDLIVSFGSYECGVQCKNYAKPVGVSAIQEAVSGRQYYSLDYAVAVAPSGFTPAARELAGKNGVALLRLEGLERLSSILECLA